MANPENLVAHRIKPGEVKNPEGRNQYSYRADAEKDLAEWCAESGRNFIREVCDRALAGQPWAANKLWDQILPTLMKHEVALTDDPEQAQLSDTLAALADRRRTNGSGRSPDTTPAEDVGS